MSEKAEASVLNLRVLLENGQLAEGAAFWRYSREAPRTAQLMAPEQEYGLDPTVGRIQHQGVARLHVPPGHWTWLRVTGGATQTAGAYERVAPFKGEKTLEIRLTKGHRTLHVFLLERDLASPAPDQDISLYRTDMRTGGQASLLMTTNTDTWGYACLRGVEPGALLVCAPGSKPGDPPPHTARLILPSGMPTLEIPCTLVVPERTIKVTLELHAVMRKVEGPAPRLFLRRLDHRPGQMYQVGPLEPGKQTRIAHVPPGEYELGVLPTGVVRIPAEAFSLDVPVDRAPVFRLTLPEEERRVGIELVGVDPRAFPVRVHVQSVAAICLVDPELQFVGPFRWSNARNRIPRLADPVRFVATGFTTCWISRSAIELSGETVSVQMLAATRLEIRCASEGRQSLWVEVDSGGVKQMIALRPALTMRKGRHAAALVGKTVVPRGKVSLQALDDAGKRLWSKTILTRRASRVVTIQG